MSKSVWRALSGLVAIAIVAIALMGMSSAQSSPSAQTASVVTALPGYSVSLFATGGKYTSPDSIVTDDKYVYVGYQNDSLPDGSNGKSSTIVQYTWDGDIVQTFTIVGHCDGLRIDPATHLVWATVNEDANAVLYIINPKSDAIVSYAFTSAPHGGGYDDLAFTNGMVFVAASNPMLNSAGVNTAPALAQITISGGKLVLTPVLMGDATALDTTTNQQVTLNEIDPDSLSLDPQGDVVLDNQAGAELVFLHNAGTAQQTVTRIPLGTQVDDSAWATAKEGKLFVVDSKANAIYIVRADFTPGTVYTEAPADSGVAGFVGTIDLTTGAITPVIIGLKSPTGLIFVADN
jgi:hypothetical protein